MPTLPSERKLLVVAYTPYHLILGKSFCEQFEGVSVDWLIIEDFPNAERFVQAIQDSEQSSYLKNVTFFPGFSSTSSKVKYTWNALKNSRALRKKWKTAPPSDLAIFNDTPYFSRICVQQAQRKNVRVNLVEDGVGIYNSPQNYKKSKLQRILLYMLFRTSWPAQCSVGDALANNPIYCLFPSEIRDYEKFPKQIQLSPKSLLNLPAGKILSQLAANFPHPINIEKHPRDVTLILLPLCQTKKRLLDLLHELHSVIPNNTDSLKYIKAHPRESTHVLEQIPKLDYTVLKPEIPAELYLLTGQITKLIGGNTSALHSARWLIPTLQVISVPQLRTNTSNRYLVFLNTIGADVHE